MKVTKAFYETVVREIELETPAFFKDSSSLVAVYSEERIISVLLLEGGYTSIRCNGLTDQRNFATMVDSAPRITEQEFNDALATAILNVSGLEIAKENSLKIAV